MTIECAFQFDPTQNELLFVCIVVFTELFGEMCASCVLNDKLLNV